MNIAFFCDAYVPTKNGVATSARTTAEELRLRGHRVVIFAPKYHGYEDEDPDIVRFVSGHWFKARDYPVAYPFASRIAPRTAIRFRQEKFDVVHVHSPFVLGGLGAHWARFQFVPLVWTFHTMYHHYSHYSITSKAASRWYIVWRVRNMLRLCDRVIAPSAAIERIIHKLRPNTPTQVLPTGVDLPRFQGGDGVAARHSLGIAPHDRVLLYVGRLAQEKNLGFLLKSLAPVLRNPPKGIRTHLVLVGGGPATENCREAAARLDISRSVHITGFAEGDRLRDLYATGDVFVFASRTETQGLAIAEAMCAGVPPVVVNAMGAPEAVENEKTGLVVPASDTRFRDAVLRMLHDDALRQRFACAALAKAPSFARQKRVDELLELYGEIILENDDRRRNFSLV